MPTGPIFCAATQLESSKFVFNQPGDFVIGNFPMFIRRNDQRLALGEFNFEQADDAGRLVRACCDSRSGRTHTSGRVPGAW